MKSRAWILPLSLLLTGVQALAQPPAQPLAAGGGFAALGIAECATDLRKLNQLSGWQVRWPQSWSELGTASDEAIRAEIERWKTGPALIEADRVTLADPSSHKAPGAIVARILVQLDDLSRTLARGAPPLRPDASPELQRDWRNLFAQSLRPAIERYRSFLRNEYRPSGDFGLAAALRGPDCYRKAARLFSTLDLGVSEIESIGWRTLRESQDELLRLHGLDRSGLPGLLDQLRKQPEPDFTADKLLALSQRAVDRGIAAVPRMFLRTKVAPIVVRPLPRQMEASFPAAAYEGSHGHDDPAVFVINLSRAAERRLMAEAIAFHETIPGHHASEGLGYPFGGPSSGFLEGWGIYAERLAGEMNLYGSRLDESGMLAKRISAAARPIVEAGLHVKGWSRPMAIRFIRAQTALGDADIEIEVDRLLAGPGQPSSYIIGYDRIVRLRERARERLGQQFDIREFHDRVLGAGARPLPVLGADIEAWLAGRGASPAGAAEASSTSGDDLRPTLP
jgi:uncharacterized protein (DUF885 family)